MPVSGCAGCCGRSDVSIGREQVHRVERHALLRPSRKAAGLFGASAVQDSRPGRDLLAHRRLLAAVQGNTSQHVQGGGDAFKGVHADGIAKRGGNIECSERFTAFYSAEYCYFCFRGRGN